MLDSAAKLLCDNHMVHAYDELWYSHSTVYSVVAAIQYPHRYAALNKPCIEFWKTLSREEREPIKIAVNAALHALPRTA